MTAWTKLMPGKTSVFLFVGLHLPGEQPERILRGHGLVELLDARAGDEARAFAEIAMSTMP